MTADTLSRPYEGDEKIVVAIDLGTTHSECQTYLESHPYNLQALCHFHIYTQNKILIFGWFVQSLESSLLR